MSRFIAYSVEPAGGGSVRLQITGQGERGDEFTPTGPFFNAANGVVLESASHPAWASPCHLYVRGSADSLDNNTTEVSRASWPVVEAAIIEYNAEYDGASLVLFDGCDSLGAGAMAADLGGPTL